MRPKPPLHLSVLLVALGALLLLPSCSSDDTSDDASSGGEFTLSSPAFDEGEAIPIDHAPDGGNQSPPLVWSGTPADAEELAITVVDPDASNFVHWVVWGIEPTVSGAVEQNQTPTGATVGLNQFGTQGWDGPQPPAGEEHTYVFTLHALSDPPAIDAETSAIEAVEAIEAATTEAAELRGQFTSG